MSEIKKTYKRRLEGVVVSDASDKTIVVSVVTRFKHDKYSKFIHKSKKFHAHDEENTAKVGDKVQIIESKPISKNKKWQLVRIL
jgi:small subunit ribosomal protein S17